ncbi:MAG: SCP2 sterol-binding domain-containing protein [Acidimicrobiales bacterium]
MDQETHAVVEFLNSTYHSLGPLPSTAEYILNVEVSDGPLSPGWSLRVSEDGLQAVATMASDPDLSISLSSEIATRLTTGELSVDAALRNGAIKFRGALGALKYFESLAPLIDSTNVEREPQ